jgi:hypothetical protein
VARTKGWVKVQRVIAPHEAVDVVAGHVDESDGASDRGENQTTNDDEPDLDAVGDEDGREEDDDADDTGWDLHENGGEGAGAGSGMRRGEADHVWRTDSLETEPLGDETAKRADTTRGTSHGTESELDSRRRTHVNIAVHIQVLGSRIASQNWSHFHVEAYTVRSCAKV